MGLYIDIHTHSASADYPTPTSAGIHPWQAASGIIDEAAMRSADLIGEIGLDYACSVDRVAQEHIFRYQLSLAQRYCKPVVLHCVRAFEPMMKILGEYSLAAVIFHGFIGSRQQAERAVARGYYLSFGEGAFRSPRTLEAMRTIPLSRLFAETDESTATIESIYQRIAHERGISTEELQEKIEVNYNKIFLQHDDR
ncbi:MAG: TatD family hydrolase [Alistipes sp.]|nr:TatD family hydrolase [Alistipes sp.]